MSEHQADPRCICGAPRSDPLHVIDHQFVMATNAEEARMSTETTTLKLRDLARRAAEQFAQAVRERAARDHAEYVDRACRAGAAVFQRQLGVDTDPEQWTPTGDPATPASAPSTARPQNSTG